MQVNIEAPSPVSRRVSVTVPADRVSRQFQAAYSRLAKRVRIPGFRAGRVPMAELRKRYAGQVASDVTQLLVDDTWSQILDEHKLDPVAPPEWDVKLVRPGQDYDYAVTIEVPADFDMKPFEELKAKLDVYEVADDDVDHEIEHIAEHFTSFTPVEGRDTAETGDRITFDFNGMIDGVPFEGGTAKGATLELGSGQFIPGFEEQVVGHALKTPFSIKVNFPDDYHAAELAGKEAEFHCEIHELAEKQIPAIDDELAKQAGADDLADLKAKVRQQMESRWENTAKRAAFDVLRVDLGKQYDFVLPPTMLKNRLEALERDQPQKDEASEGDSASEEKVVDLQAQAEQELRSELVLDTIADQENLQATEREIQETIEINARSMGAMGVQFRQLFRDPARRAGLARSLRQDKALELVLSKADVERETRPVPKHDHGHDH